MPSKTRQVDPDDLHIKRPWSYTAAVVGACTAAGIATDFNGGWLFLIAFAARFILPSIAKRVLPDYAVNFIFTTKEEKEKQELHQVFMDAVAYQQAVEVDGVHFSPERMTMVDRFHLFVMTGVHQTERGSTMQMEYVANSRLSHLPGPEQVAANSRVAADLPSDLFMRNYYLPASPELGMMDGDRHLRFTERCDGDLVGRTMTLTQLRETVRVVSHGLAALHGRGIVHGDLKPAQLFIQGDKVRHADFLNTTMKDGRQHHDATTQGYTMTRLLERDPRIQAALGQAGTVRHRENRGESLRNELRRLESGIFHQASQLSGPTDVPSSKRGMRGVLGNITTSIAKAQMEARERAESFDVEAKPVDDIYAAGLTLAEVAVECPDLWKEASDGERQGLFTLITNCLAVARSPETQREAGIEQKDVIQDGAQLQAAADRWLARDDTARVGTTVAGDDGATAVRPE